MVSIVNTYLNLSSDTNHRYNSWKHCYSAFGEVKNIKILSLHLGFYLASWGMYRGSSGLLQKDYLVHQGAVEILINFVNLRCIPDKEVKFQDTENILDLIKKLQDYYKNITYILDNKTKHISPTDTLISKILLGTLGCIPAYDRFFKDGAIKEGIVASTINKNSLIALFNFIKENKKELSDIQQQLLSKTNFYYPIMKIVDMYFWKIGYDLDKK
ncbi:hypothetical protein [Aquimarina algiphila]|uniref:hypothetical protein n=1 Tax=Aquimarina algiphila TaxID=2047982 RepID=UPI002330D47D|nr:hypothetical protein [Aquimarina algiphila]